MSKGSKYKRKGESCFKVTYLDFGGISLGANLLRNWANDGALMLKTIFEPHTDDKFFWKFIAVDYDDRQLKNFVAKHITLARTNKLGTFFFTAIRPGHGYFRVFLVKGDCCYVDSLSFGWNREVDGRENHCDGVCDWDVF